MSKIMIIDDDRTVVDLMMISLRRHGYELIGITDPTEAVEKAAEFLPDLIIVDLRMPVMDGCETCAALRSVPELSSTPIILLTAQSVNPYDPSRKQAPWSHIEQKPVRISNFLNAVESLLGASQGVN